MVYGTFQLESLGGNLSLGAFLSTLNVFKEMGVEMAEVFAEVMEIIKATGPLKKICFFMNRPANLHQRMEKSRQQKVKGHARRLDARSNSLSGLVTNSSGERLFAVDTLKLELANVAFRYESKVVVRGMSHEFPQGKLYGFIGEEQQGKATLLRMLGGVLVPEDGEVFIPPHMRVLHVVKEPLCLEESFIRNLVFDQDISILGGYKRIRRICERLEFPQSHMDMLDASWKMEEQGGRQQIDTSWHSKFSNTDFARLNIARALTMNPECLVMQMPFITFSDELARKMIAMIRLHIPEKGLELPEAARPFRRPRTVFFSSSALERCRAADCVFEVSAKNPNLIQEVRKDLDKG